MTQAAGIVFILLGIVIIYFINRRKFNRRTFTGMQAFSSYEASVATRLTESLFRAFAMVLIFGGMFLAAVAYYNS